ncbi:MAG: hypothetical protein ACXQS8_06690 [Candidatus Helarchaeales archaeon]
MSEKEVESLLKKHYPFLFKKDEMKDSILLVDPSFRVEDKESLLYYNNKDFKNCSDLHSLFCGAHMQTSNRKCIMIDRITKNFKWTDYKVFERLLSESIYPIILVTEKLSYITPSIRKKLKVVDIRSSRDVKDDGDVKSFVEALFNEEDRNLVLQKAFNLKQPWIWSIGWIREIILKISNPYVKEHLLEVIEFIDENKFKVSKDYLLSYLVFATFPLSRKVHPRFPLQWKKKDEQKKEVEVKKFKVKKTAKKKKATKKKKKKKEKKKEPEITAFIL